MTRYICKRCGAESPVGVGYVLAPGERPDRAEPEPGCPNPHLTTSKAVRDLAAAVISRARRDHGAALGEGAPAFDYAIAGGSHHAEQALWFAVWVVANGEVHEMTGTEEEQAARAHALAREVEHELDLYRQRCKARTYTGWSNADGGPVRYAGPGQVP